jgi:hypothetical protein
VGLEAGFCFASASAIAIRSCIPRCTRDFYPARERAEDGDGTRKGQ